MPLKMSLTCLLQAAVSWRLREQHISLATIWLSEMVLSGSRSLVDTSQEAKVMDAEHDVDGLSDRLLSLPDISLREGHGTSNKQDLLSISWPGKIDIN